MKYFMTVMAVLVVVVALVAGSAAAKVNVPKVKSAFHKALAAKSPRLPSRSSAKGRTLRALDYVKESTSSALTLNYYETTTCDAGSQFFYGLIFPTDTCLQNDDGGSYRLHCTDTDEYAVYEGFETVDCSGDSFQVPWLSLNSCTESGDDDDQVDDGVVADDSCDCCDSNSDDSSSDDDDAPAFWATCSQPTYDTVQIRETGSEHTGGMFYLLGVCGEGGDSSFQFYADGEYVRDYNYAPGSQCAGSLQNVLSFPLDQDIDGTTFHYVSGPVPSA